MDELKEQLTAPAADVRDIGALIEGLTARELALAERWPTGAHAGQLPPEGDWDVWLMMAGRGFGKTRGGAEWVHGLALAGGAGVRIALVGATLDEARAIMVEGVSGLFAVAPPGERPDWFPAQRRLVWPGGAEAKLYSGARPDALRGPQHHYAWCDEIAKWAYPGASWDNLRLGLRLGKRPRALVTTTPRPIALLRALVATPGVVVTGGATRDNAALAPGFVAAMTALHGGTYFGRQELDGALIEEIAGALWTRGMVEACRVRAVAEPVRRVVVGVDPPASAGGDACGIVCVALGVDDLGYVIEDASAAGLSPEGWAGRVADVATRHGADRVIAEANNGGDMVRSVLRAADCALPVTLVHAARGKSARAEPVAALYERGRVKHVGAFPDLEDELCGLIAGGGYDGPGRSPDRADALVWAIWALMLARRGGMPGVRVV